MASQDRLIRYLPSMALAVSAAIATACADSADVSHAPMATVATGEFGEFGEDDFVEQEGFGLTYYVYVPSSYKPEQAAPLVVFLHGCNGDALEQARTTTGWAQLAETEGFLAVFPQATEPLRCWFFANPADNSRRDSGDAGAIARITQQVMKDWAVDEHRVFLDGYSAGGTMASVMGATYPDLYAAIGMVEGCPYLCADDAGSLAYNAMGEHARVLPVFIVTGTQGGFVAGGIGALEQWLGTNDLADDGSLNLSIPRLPATTDENFSGRGLPYSVEHYSDSRGDALIERWVIHGMYHEYPEPGGDLPDATAGAYRFFAAHAFQ